jgi:hypothetical protein
MRLIPLMEGVVMESGGEISIKGPSLPLRNSLGAADTPGTRGLIVGPRHLRPSGSREDSISNPAICLHCPSGFPLLLGQASPAAIRWHDAGSSYELTIWGSSRLA